MAFDDRTGQGPLVSVVIPSFNHARYIRDCLDSVLSQGYRPLEVVVVDDGSTDGTVEAIRSYGSAVHLLEQTNGRQARGRNIGLAHARGELVAFLDSDDRFLPDRLAAAVAVFHDRPDTDVVWSDYRVVDATGRTLEEARYSPRHPDFARDLLAGNPICNASVTIRRSTLLAIGGFDERVPRACDGLAWYQVAAAGGRFVHLARPLLEYRLHGGNDGRHFVPMTRERDLALTLGVKAYLSHGLLPDPADLRWARGVMVRQLAFRAAASVERAFSHGLAGRLRARGFDVLGSDAGLWLLAAMRGVKRRLLRAGSP
jgi:glycosyltransferase involved in cell wall biosynthesis